MKLKVVRDKKRIKILAYSTASYDHDDGWFEIANIKMSKSKNTFMDDWNLDELMANIHLNKEEAE